LFAEIRYRKLNFALSLAAVTIAVALFVAGPMLVDAYRQETQNRIAAMEDRVAESEALVDQIETNMKTVKQATEAELAALEKQTRFLMKNMGFNLMIVHRDTNMSDFWAEDFAAADMPQDYVKRLADDGRLTLVSHLVATLQARIAWNDRKALLVGYLPETTQAHGTEKAPMGYRPEEGTVYLGHELAGTRKDGDVIDVLGKEFRIARVMPEQGSKEDISIIMHLSDAQGLLEKPGKVNQIMALGCHCADADLPNIRKQLAGILPDTHITEFRSIALARAEQRTLVEAKQGKIVEDMQANLAQSRQILDERREILEDLKNSRAKIQRLMETLSQVITPLVVLASVVWVGLLALANVRERRTEIGILRAIGKRSGMIATLFLGKAVLTGLVGAVVGIGLGLAAAEWLGSKTLELPYLAIQLPALLAALLGAPLLSALASYPPTLSALHQDPAVVLRDQ